MSTSKWVLKNAPPLVSFSCCFQMLRKTVKRVLLVFALNKGQLWAPGFLSDEKILVSDSILFLCGWSFQVVFHLCWLYVHWNCVGYVYTEMCWLCVRWNCVGYEYPRIVLVICTSELCWLWEHWIVLVMYTLIFITHSFSRKFFFTVPVILCFCVWMTFMCLDVWHILFVITHFMMSNMTSIIFKTEIWIVAGNMISSRELSMCSWEKMYLPVDTWSDVVCDSQVIYLIWMCCFAWVSCPVIKVGPWSSKLFLHLRPRFPKT